MKKLSNFWRLPYSRPPPPAREKARTPAKKVIHRRARKLSTSCESYPQAGGQVTRWESYPQAMRVQVGGESYPQAGGQLRKLSTDYAGAARCESYPQAGGQAGKLSRWAGYAGAGGQAARWAGALFRGVWFGNLKIILHTPLNSS